MVGKAGACRNGADCARVASKLLTRPRNALAPQELAHRMTKPSAKQPREVHGVNARNLRHLGKPGCYSGAGTQVFRDPVVTSDGSVSRILQCLSTSDRVIRGTCFPVLDHLLPHERNVVRVESDVEAEVGL